MFNLVFLQKKSFTFCYWTVRNANRATKMTQRWLCETVVDLKTRPRKELTHTTKMGFPTLNLVKAHRLRREGNFTSKNSEFWESKVIFFVPKWWSWLLVQLRGNSWLYSVLKLETSEVSEEFRVINVLTWPWKDTTIFILNFGPRMLSFKTRNIQDG